MPARGKSSGKNPKVKNRKKLHISEGEKELNDQVGVCHKVKLEEEQGPVRGASQKPR